MSGVKRTGVMMDCLQYVTEIVTECYPTGIGTSSDKSCN